jgi:hypothetical protein
MKATNIISALSLVLVFAANSLFAGNGINGPGVANKTVTYQVMIKSAPNFPAAGQYLVAVTDENGHRIAPAQGFRPGISAYTFSEPGDFKGIRIAVLVPLPGNPLYHFSASQVRNGLFVGGQTYRFELTPKSIERWDPAGNGN